MAEEQVLHNPWETKSVQVAKPLLIIENDEERMAEGRGRFPEAAPRYSYKPLKSDNNFRLLKLESGTGNDVLQGTLMEYDIEFSRSPPYSALSYTWNDKRHDLLMNESHRLSRRATIRSDFDIRHPLWCEGCVLLISTNLYNALMRIRLPEESRMLWIDQLCINQHDYDERATQVMIMPKIYHKAAEVLFWVGEGDDKTHEALQILGTLGKARRDIERKGRTFPQPQDLYSKIVTDGLGVPPCPSDPWKAVIEFFERPVFRRIWIIQELVTATARMQVICGGSQDYSFETLLDAAIFLNSTSWSGSLDVEYKTGGSMLLSIQCLMAILDAKLMWLHQSPHLRRLLVDAAQRFGATDARDKVYALYGLINDSAHRDIHDLHHGGDSVVDTLGARGFNVKRTLGGDITGQMSDSGTDSYDEDVDGVYDEAVRILHSSENEFTLELLSSLNTLLTLVVDSLTDILDLWCGHRKPKIVKSLVSTTNPTSETKLDAIDEVLKSVQRILVNREQDLEGDAVQQFMPYMFGRLQRSIGLVHGVYQSRYADFGDRSDAHVDSMEWATTLRQLAGDLNLSESEWDAILDQECHGREDDFESDDRLSIAPFASLEEKSSSGSDGNEEEIRESFSETNAMPTENSPLDTPFSTLKFNDKSATELESEDDGDSDVSSPRQGSKRQLYNNAIEERLPVTGRSASEKSMWEPWSSKTSNLTKPDYQMPVEQVYFEFTLHCLEADGNLDILSLVRPTNRWYPGYRYWAPDFNLTREVSDIALVRYSNSASCFYCAGGSMKSFSSASPCFERDPNDASVIKPTHKHIDKIAIIDEIDVFPPHRQVFEWLELVQDSGSRYHTGETVRRALWRTLIGNQVEGPAGPIYHAPENFKENFKAFLTVSEMLNWGLSTKEETEEALSKKGMTLDDFDALIPLHQAYIQAMSPILQKRRFFVTEEGWFGVGPTSMIEGDTICIMKGGRVPYVIRRASWDDEQDTTDEDEETAEATDQDGETAVLENELTNLVDEEQQFIGECYLHGIMNGEAADDDEMYTWKELKLV